MTHLRRPFAFVGALLVYPACPDTGREERRAAPVAIPRIALWLDVAKILTRYTFTVARYGVSSAERKTDPNHPEYRPDQIPSQKDATQQEAEHGSRKHADLPLYWQRISPHEKIHRKPTNQCDGDARETHEPNWFAKWARRPSTKRKIDKCENRTNDGPDNLHGSGADHVIRVVQIQVESWP